MRAAPDPVNRTSLGPRAARKSVHLLPQREPDRQRQPYRSRVRPVSQLDRLGQSRWEVPVARPGGVLSGHPDSNGKASNPWQQGQYPPRRPKPPRFATQPQPLRGRLQGDDPVGPWTQGGEITRRHEGDAVLRHAPGSSPDFPARIRCPPARPVCASASASLQQEPHGEGTLQRVALTGEDVPG